MANSKLRGWLTHPITRWGITLAYTAFISMLLLQSSGNPTIGPAAPPGDPTPGRELQLTLGHVAAFGGLTVLLWWALSFHLHYRYAVAGAAIFSTGFGLFTEYMQINVPDRNASWWDIFINTLVTFSVAGILYAWHYTGHPGGIPGAWSRDETSKSA